MERHFIFEKINTWLQWHLIVTGKEITPPEPKTNLVELDGMDGTLDLSEALSGRALYNDRTISASFWTDYGTRADRELIRQEIVNTLHGKKLKIFEPDDSTHYFVGRVNLSSFTNIIPYMEFSLEAICEPWRYSIDETTRIIANNTTGPRDFIIINKGSKMVCPDLVSVGDCTINNIPVAEGKNKISDIKLFPGANLLTVSGNCNIDINFREAIL